jgi:phosphatidylinositol alpha-1,6-mannosyltransferase
MKILYLAVGVFDKGGISRYCRYQIRALREAMGQENVHVLSLMPRGANDFEEDFPADRAFGGIGLRSEVEFLRATVNAARSMRPEVIWSSHVRFVPNGLLARAGSGAALVVNVYGEEMWSGKLLPLHKRTVRRADLVVSDCHFTADVVAKDFKVDRARLGVVWDCVDLDRFEPRPRSPGLMKRLDVPVAPDNRYLMTLGRIEERCRYKGYDRLLDALKAMPQQRNLILLIAGSGNDVERLRHRARGEGLADRVLFPGSIPEKDLCDVYNVCDVFALVSDRGPGRGEGTPFTLLEAAACGKPIIVGDEDGSREAVIQGVNGFIVSPRDPLALSHAIKALMLDEKLCKQMGKAARARIELEFSYDRFRDKTLALLDRVASTTRANQQ